ncbi:MAG: imidazole glycerol phosphate synthase subunit HisH, partial [Oscillospiraceae bacterium]|nr:imidazole glycerol phosphate synthase subunit HisH [Oscillospiraceae bacterium]
MIRIINYKAGNAPSVLRAVTHLGFEAAFARGPADLEDATHIILPGVGSARATMDSLRELELIEALEEAVRRQKKPFLGICVGMQILFEHSEEEDTPCLGWLKGRVLKFDAAKVRVPQMGWNRVRLTESPLCPAAEDYFYFVNSYYAKPAEPAELWGTAEYEGPFAAAVRRGKSFPPPVHPP